METLLQKIILFFIILKLTNSNEITLVVKGIGEQKIFSEEFINGNELPDEIIIDGKRDNYSNNEIELESRIYNISLIWNDNKLANGSGMFKNLEYIINFIFKF